MHLHAATTVDARDRPRLEWVCRYLLRPPFAHDAVQARPDGRVRVHLKTVHADMSTDKFLASCAPSSRRQAGPDLECARNHRDTAQASEALLRHARAESRVRRSRFGFDGAPAGPPIASERRPSW
jgi:hypothetical protein